MVDFLSGKVKKTSPADVPENRYKFLKLQDAEPDLGVAEGDGYILTTNDTGVRVWKEPSEISGFLGSTGYTGSQGNIGFTGSRGFAGSQGAAGGEGSIGFTGSQGIQGFTGSQGIQGIQGFTGSQGIQGIQGIIGFTGSQGVQGIQGFTGSQGVQGIQGFTGSQGVIGFAGSQGVIGLTGSQGIQGVIGFTGSQGIQGVIGFTGSQGIQGFTGSIGFTGSQGVIGFTGSQGFVGSQGSTGFTGSKGADGNFGGASFDYTFDTGTAASDPGIGRLRFSSSNLSLATALYIDEANDAATDISSFLNTIAGSTSNIKGHFRVSKKFDDNTFALYTISGLTDNTGWFTVNSSYVSGSGSFVNNEDIVITFARTGDRGDIGFTGSRGLQGFTGSQGIQGVIGFTGSQGIQGAIGFTGSQGIQGVIGFTGSQGIQGIQGIIGFTGSRGNVGFTGSQGAIGLTGSQGITGFTGSLGFTGSAGPSNIINATNDTSETTHYPVFVSAAGSDQTPRVRTTSTALSYIPSTGKLTASIVGLGSNSELLTASATTTTISPTAVSSWSATTYGGAKIIIEAKTGSNRHITEMVITHDGTTAIATEYASVWTASQLASFDVDINGGDVRLIVTAASTDSTNYKVTQILMLA